MAGERPDYNKLSAIQGLDGTTLRVVAVDASGRIIMLPYGVMTVDGAVDVTQVDSTRTVQGTDGLTLHTLVVDSAGRLIMVPIGASGNYMSVDANGYLSSVMKGLDGATLRTIAVDASGNIIGILKGDYEGAVKTLAVDAQGRMLAVLTDPEDVFGNPNYMGAAELVVRLGSIVNGDRLGQVVFMEDFEAGIAKWASTVSAGCAVTASAKTAYNGAFSAKLSVDNTAGHSAYIERGVPCSLPATRIGAEMAFTMSTEAGDAILQLYVFDGATKYLVGVKYDPLANMFYYYNDGLSWTAIGAQPLVSNDITAWGRVKFVVDIATKKYVKALLNGKIYDLSAVPIFNDPSLLSPILYIHIECAYRTGAQILYIDDLVMTVNEP